MSFEALLNDLEVLKKSQSVGDNGEGDNKIQAAAAEGGAGAGGEGGAEGGTEGGAGAGAGAEGGEGGDDTLGKSMTVMVNGQEVEAIDGTALVKSLIGKVDAIQGERTTEKEHLTKALGLLTDMVKDQGVLIKSLQEQLTKVSGQGAGRKSTVVVDAALAKSLNNDGKQVQQLSGPEILAKCETLFGKGQLSSLDLSIAESSVNRGVALPAHIQTKLAQA